jgi:hypothetical protein
VRARAAATLLAALLVGAVSATAAPAEDSRGAPQPLIVGGEGISIAEAPWQVAVDYSPAFKAGNGFRRGLCGGTLVAPTLVVTAAHCVSNDDGVFQPASHYSVISGRSMLAASDGLESLVDRIFVFKDARGKPLFDRATGAWDMVMLHLTTAAVGTPIKLAGADEAALWAPGRPAFVSGWGSVSERPRYPHSLRGAEIGVMPNSTCEQIYVRGWDPTTSMCAGTFLGQRDTCYGDSGGPLVVATSTGEFRLVGDTSFGRRCGSVNSPGVYGRLAADPVRAALQDAATQMAGAAIIGSGGLPPTTLTQSAARENAWIVAQGLCRRRCVSYEATPCAVSGDGWACTATTFLRKPNRSRFHCARKLFVSAATGTLERTLATGKRCHRGW